MPRFVVVVVKGDPYDSHAARTFEQAMEIANPDKGSLIEVYKVSAPDAGAARLPAVYKTRGRKQRTFHYKRKDAPGSTARMYFQYLARTKCRR